MLNENDLIVEKDYEAIKNFLSLQSNEVQENSTIVASTEFNPSFTLHIDKNAPNVFTPRMPQSAMKGENYTCPRVSTSNTLLGCYIGYNRGEYDLIKGYKVDNINESDNYLGGYLISKIDFKHALMPNSALIPDANKSEELWLVNYTPETAEYRPITIGKVFISKLTYIPVIGSIRPSVTIDFYIENNSDDLIAIDKVNLIGRGYFKLNVRWLDSFDMSISNANITLESISKIVYEQCKSKQAELLEFKAPLPGYSKW